MNYTELVQAIKDYTEYEEATFVANIDTFIRNAEVNILRTVEIPELRKNSGGVLTQNYIYLQRPSDFLAPFSLALLKDGNWQFLLEKDVSFMREAFPGNSASGTPKYYAQYQGNVSTNSGFFILGPMPDDNYTVELHYYYTPASIVDTGTSWLGKNAAPALLYGSLVEAYIFMKGDSDVMQQYMSRYQSAMQSIFKIDVLGSMDEYREGQVV